MSEKKTPFIGQKVILLTKGLIKYEGILNDIDVANNLLTLSNVKSFGTEDRKRADSKYIPPTDMVYELIQFKAGQIQDVMLNDSVEQTEVAEEYIDPAIADYKKAEKPKYEITPPRTELGKLNMEAGNREDDRDVRRRSADGMRNENRDGSGDSGSFNRNQNFLGGEAPRQDSIRENRYDNKRQNYRRGRGGGNYRGGWGNRGRNYRYNYDSNYGEIDQEMKKKYEEDFDFESMNAKFDKSEAVERMAGLMKVNHHEDQEGTYEDEGIEEDAEKGEMAEGQHEEKRGSFFDSISYEASDREAGKGRRIDRNELQKVDMETFGEVFAGNRGGKRFGNYNNRRQHRGRGWYGNYNNRYNTNIGGNYNRRF